MTPSEKVLVQTSGRRVPAGTILTKVLGDDSRSSAVSDFCDQLQQLVPQLSVVARDTEGSDPAHLLLPSGIRYLGIPQANELPPFLDALTGALPPLTEALGKRLNQLSGPTLLELYITPQCTFCPAAVRRIIPLASANRLIRLSIIDGFMYPELSRRNGIRSVPTLMLDEQYHWTGSIDLEELATLMATRDPVSLTPTAVEMMLKQGAAKRLAVMMDERNAIFPALIELLCHEQWPVRLGAMVTMEELTALNPQLAEQVIDPLCRRMDLLPEAIQGDLVYVLGEIGGPVAISRLRTFLQSHRLATVREAVQETLDQLKP
jgi:hypothetical protein